MALLQQIIELLSRPPGSVIYHLVTLFALQVVLALAFSRWQRDPNDEAARRMTFAPTLEERDRGQVRILRQAQPFLRC